MVLHLFRQALSLRSATPDRKVGLSRWNGRQDRGMFPLLIDQYSSQRSTAACMTLTPLTAMAPRLIENRLEMASLLQIEHLISMAGMKEM